MTAPVQALKLALQPPPPYKTKPWTESRQNQAGKQETQENRNRKQPTIQMVRKLSLRLQALGFKIPLSAVRRTWMRRISCGFWRGRCAKITGRFFDNGALRTTRAGLPEQDSCPRAVGRNAPARKRCPLVFAPPKYTRKPHLNSLPTCPTPAPPPPHKPKSRTTSQQSQAGKQETQENRNRKQPIDRRT